MVIAHMTNPETHSAREIPATTETVIIGAGIVGISTAWFLSRRGQIPLVIDAGDQLASRTTNMSAHCIRAQFSEPDSIAMMGESLDFYESFAEHLGLDADSSPIGLTQQGYLFASTDPRDVPAFADRVAFQRSHGLNDVTLLDGDEVRYRYPWLSPAIVTATYRRRDGWIDSGMAVAAMAAASGCPVHLQTRVTSIEVTGGRVTGVVTDRGQISCERVILAAGPFTGTISPEPLPLSQVRRHRLIVRQHPRIPQAGPVTIDANTGAHWRPHQGGALMAWAQPEAPTAPLWPVPADPSFIDLVLRGDSGVGRIAPFWHELWPSIDPSDLYLTAGQYTITPDHKPLIGPAPSTDGLYLNTGYSGHGIMGAPSGARLLVDLLSGTDVAHNPFSPDRDFGLLSHTGERMVI